MRIVAERLIGLGKSTLLNCLRANIAEIKIAPELTQMKQFFRETNKNSIDLSCEGIMETQTLVLKAVQWKSFEKYIIHLKKIDKCLKIASY